MTAAQFLDKIRGRMKLTRMQTCHLVSEKGSSLVMSQNMGHVYRDNKSKNGLLYFSCTTESAFGCPLPPKLPVKRMFPGEEAMPFGAPEPVAPPLSDGSMSEDEATEDVGAIPNTNQPPPNTNQPMSPMDHYHQWLAQYHQQQQNLVNMVNDYIAAHHEPHFNGSVYHVFHPGAEGGQVHMVQDLSGTFEPMPEFVVVDVTNVGGQQ